MESIRDFVKSNVKKDMIRDLLNKSFPIIPKKSHEEMTELISLKLDMLEELKASLIEDTNGALQQTADQYGATKEAVLDSFMFFYVIVELVYSQKLLAELTDLKEG